MLGVVGSRFNLVRGVGGGQLLQLYEGDGCEQHLQSCVWGVGDGKVLQQVCWGWWWAASSTVCGLVGNSFFRTCKVKVVVWRLNYRMRG